MAGSTYTPIATYTVSGSTTGTISFNSFSGYTDLIFVINTIHTAASRYTLLNLNSDSGANYSLMQMGSYGSGSAFSAKGTGNTSIIPLCNSYESTTDFSNAQIHLMNYANTSAYKIALVRSGLPSSMVSSQVYTYRSTSAITSAAFTTSGVGSGYFAAGSTFTVYGILAA